MKRGSLILAWTISIGILMGPMASCLARAVPAEGTVGTGPLQVLKTLKVGGAGGWDYLTVDPTTRRLYVSHATRVMVLDLDRDASLGEIPDTPGVHGIVLVPERNEGFITNGRAGTLTVFDLKTSSW